MVIKFREFHRRMSVKTTYGYSLFILNNLYKCLFELFGLIYLEVFLKFIIYSFFNIKQDSSIVTFSVGVYSILYHGSWTEANGFWFSFKRDSDIPRKSKLKLCSLISVESSSKWNGSEKMFKWKKEKCLFVFLNRAVISFGS